jgi:DNA-binding GntR family transcriptional regulator
MPAIQNFPAIAESVNYVNDKIMRSAWLPGDRLPSMRELARCAGVSTPSMCKALVLLKKQGVVKGAAHRRLYVAGNGAVPSPVQEKVPQWRLKKNLVEKEIVSGSFGLGVRLPLLKELQARYGVCYVTMKRVMRALASE